MGQESEAGGRQEDSWPREGGVWRELSRNTGNTKNTRIARKTWHDAKSPEGD